MRFIHAHTDKVILLLNYGRQEIYFGLTHTVTYINIKLYCLFTLFLPQKLHILTENSHPHALCLEVICYVIIARNVHTNPHNHN